MVNPDEASKSVHLVGSEPAQLDFVERNPYVHFMISEAWAAASSFAVYVFSHATSYGIELVNAWLPLSDDGPIKFLGFALHWGAALSASIGFAVITGYQIAILIRRLLEDARK